MFSEEAALPLVFIMLQPDLGTALVLTPFLLRRYLGRNGAFVLSLLLGEADLLAERGAPPPLLLLDDVLSELDGERRRVLARLLEDEGQTLITATSAAALPAEPAQLLEVTPGRALAK